MADASPRIAYGSVLRARPCHPIHRRGGDGVAFVTHVDVSGFTFTWVSGDPATPGFSGDVGSLRHLDTWFEIVPDAEVENTLPEGFVAPVDPRKDPMASFMTLFPRP